jgi:hypothetical protein
MSNDILNAEKAHLSSLLEAVQRCVYFLHASDQKLTWPLTAEYLTARKKDVSLFESLAAINELLPSCKTHSVLQCVTPHYYRGNPATHF